MAKHAIDFERLTASEVSKATGYSTQSVNTWRRAGCPRNTDGTYSLPLVLKWREARRSDKPEEGSWESEGQKWRALRHKFALEREQGKFIDIELAARFFQERVLESRSILQSAGQGLAASIFGLPMADVKERVDDVLRRACESIHAKWLESLTEPVGPDAGDEN